MSVALPILIYGATGATGRSCVLEAEAGGLPYLVGGRDEAALRAVAGPSCLGVRVAPADAIDPALEGIGAMVSTVGPFARHGLPVLDGAITAGVPYVDTTAEQPFLRLAKARDEAAQAAGVAVLPACGVEYLPMLVGAALLGPGPVETWLWLDDFLPTKGSVRSMVAVAGVGRAPRPRRVRAEERDGWAIGIPGAEEVLVHPDSRAHLVLARRIEAEVFRVGWPLARWLDLPALADRIAARVTDPTPEQQQTARFTVVVAQGERAVRIDGEDVYRSTARFVVRVAGMLAEGRASVSGVRSVGEALSPHEVLDAVGLTARPCPRPA